MGSEMANDDVGLKTIAASNTILRGLVGSSVHGLVLDGTDDRDEMGVCVEPRRYVVVGKFGQWVYRSAAEREGRTGAPVAGRRFGSDHLQSAQVGALGAPGQSDRALALVPAG
jgi:hypothetical protein